jgi:putative membrane protein
MWNGGMWSGWMHGGGWGLGILFWIVIAVAAVWAIRGFSSGWKWRPPGSGDPRETPLDVLRRRYASGEISREEFEQKLRELS